MNVQQVTCYLLPSQRDCALSMNARPTSASLLTSRSRSTCGLFELYPLLCDSPFLACADRHRARYAVLFHRISRGCFPACHAVTHRTASRAQCCRSGNFRIPSRRWFESAFTHDIPDSTPTASQSCKQPEAIRAAPRHCPQILLAALCVTLGRPHQVLDAIRLTHTVPDRGKPIRKRPNSSPIAPTFSTVFVGSPVHNFWTANLSP
ncbi:hypothetical protein C7401_1042 [Paraburkholderia unamae]|nr:hypothetical protein C7401_1042 [Paraburkholderia unamae]